MHQYGARHRRRIDAIEALQTVQGGAIFEEGAFISVKSFGATGNGVTDDTAAIQRAVTVLAGTGITVWFPAGTYLVDGQVILPTGLVTTIRMGSGVTILGGNTASTLTLGTLFFGPTPAISSATTLNGNNTVGASSVTTTVAVPGGTYIQIVSATHSPVSAIYRTEAGAPSTTPTLDRPGLFPFANGDVVNVLATAPAILILEGEGATFTGTAVAFINGIYWHSKVQDLNMVAPSGAHFDAMMVWNNGSYDCIGTKIYGDGTGGPGGFNVGAAAFGEQCGYSACVMSHIANGTGFKLVDARCPFVRDCKAPNCEWGVIFTSDAGNYGTLWGRVEGGNFDGCSQAGIYIGGGGSYEWVDGATANYGTGTGALTGGIVLDGTASVVTGAMTGNKFGTVIANGNAGNGMTVAAGASGTTVDDLTTDGNAGTGLVTSGPTQIGRHRCYTTTPPGVASPAILSAGATTKIDEFDYSCIPSSGASFAVQTSGANRLDICNGTLVLGTNCIGFDAAASGARVAIDHSTIAPTAGATGTIGLYAPAASGIIDVGTSVDPSTCATPVDSAGGTINIAQAGALPVAQAAGSQTFAWTQAASIVTTGTSGTIVENMGVPNVPFLVDNTAASGSATVKAAAGDAGITILAGKSAWVKTSAAGTVMIRVTADT